ncbi:hypothetical protein V6N11_022097 [Hibiscus sabdariffa]|uniref:Uncharacterized protein n=1 Tax=Hibiscus sabdariffa TaxID=183260 RepID=A0ABR2TIK1_9ROSI
MELQLGLALPTPPLIPMEMLDLNLYGWVQREALGSNALSWPLLNNSSGSKPPCCDEASLVFVDRRIVPKTLPLFHWSNRPDGPRKELDDNFSSSSSFYKNDREGLVGRPAVKTWRKKQGHQICDGRGGRASKSTYVRKGKDGRSCKLQMAGRLTLASTTPWRHFDENVWPTTEKETGGLQKMSHGGSSSSSSSSRQL